MVGFTNSKLVTAFCAKRYAESQQMHPRKLWKEKPYRLCDGYSESDIFNCDETGLMFRAIPDKTLTMKNDKCFGRKITKQRLTVLLCSNMLSDFEKPLIIGNARNPKMLQRSSTRKSQHDLAGQQERLDDYRHNDRMAERSEPKNEEFKSQNYSFSG
jgi:hypothetical protein